MEAVQRRARYLSLIDLSMNPSEQKKVGEPKCLRAAQFCHESKMIFLPRNTFCTRLLLSDNRILSMFVLLLSFRNDYSATLWVQFCLFALPWLAHFDRNWCLKLNCSCKYPGYSPFQNFDIFVHLWKRFCAVKKTEVHPWMEFSHQTNEHVRTDVLPRLWGLLPCPPKICSPSIC